MFISVIIPVREISSHLIVEGFPAFQNQTNRNFEVIVVCDNNVGMSVVESLQRKYKWIKIIKYPGSPSEKRNFGVKKAQGGILAFIDDDAYPNSNWIKRIVGAGLAPAQGRRQASPLQRIVAVCGPGILPLTDGFSEKVFDSILTSKLGSGMFTYRFQKEKSRFVDDYPLMNFAIFKKTYKKFGGLLDYWPGEDSKLCEKIIKAGFRIKYSPQIVVFHHRKNNLLEFLRQHSRYGFQRGLFFAEGDKNSRKPIYFLPSLFLIYLFFIPLFIMLTNNYLLILPMAAYSTFVIIFFILQIYRKLDIKHILLSSVVLVSLHVTYAIFFVKGSVKGFLKDIKG